MLTNPVLQTPRLELRPLSMADVDALWPYVSDPELPRHMRWDAHRSPKQTADYVEATMGAQELGAEAVWTLRLEGELVGMMGLHRIVRVAGVWRHDSADLGYWCGPPFRNKGLITEAARAVLHFGFRSLDLHKITVGCATENVPSRRVIEKLGFRLIGEQRDHFFRFDRWWNHLFYEMVVDEYREA